MIEKIISGGQSGVDRAALDWAIQHGIPHGGWCPKGRRAEDGIIPEPYQLKETPRRSYQQRTKWNVRDSDATLVVTLKKELSGGSQLTQQFAQKLGKPWLHVFSDSDWEGRLNVFIDQHPVAVLNVAGPRESSAPGIVHFVEMVLNALAKRTDEGCHGDAALTRSAALSAGASEAQTVCPNTPRA